MASPKIHWFLFDDDNDVFFNWSSCVSGGPNHHPFPQKGSCHSVGVGFVLSGSPWHQCWWSLPEVVQHLWRNASLTFSNAPTGPGESYGRFGLLDFCKPFQDVSSFLPAPVRKSLKKHPVFPALPHVPPSFFLNQLSGDVAFCWVLSFIYVVGWSQLFEWECVSKAQPWMDCSNRIGSDSSVGIRKIRSEKSHVLESPS